MPFEDLDGRGLAGAVRAEEREHLASRHLEIDVVHGDPLAVALQQPFDADHRVGRHPAIFAPPRAARYPRMVALPSIERLNLRSGCQPMVPANVPRCRARQLPGS